MTAAIARRPSIAHRHGASSATVRWRPEPGCDVQAPVVLRHRVPTSGPCAAAPRPRMVAARIRRRRLVLGAAAAGMLVALALPWGGAGGHTLATPGPVLAGATVSHHAPYIVQPGDTMWSIAERLEPGADPRVIVAQLQAQVGSDTLQAGEQLRLP